MVAPKNEILPPETGARQAGAVIGHFELMRRLGSGGMGEVFLARDRQLGRKVALKLISGSVTGKSLERLLTEAQTMAQLNHPHIATVYEAGTADGTPFIALEYL